MSVPQINENLLRRENWSVQESENACMIADFMQNLMNNHNFDYVMKNFHNDAYTQHNRGIPDGLYALVEYVKSFVKQFPEYSYNVKHVHTDGEYVIFHSHVTVKKTHRGNDKKGFNIIDRWRLKDGKIVEHWDAIQPLDLFMRFYVWLNGGKVLNNNGIF